MFVHLFIILVSLVAQVFVPGFPKETLMILSGIIGGIFIGSIINLLGLVIGAQLAYETARIWSIPIMKKIDNNEKMIKIKEKIETQATFWGLILIRLPPNSPNDLISFTCGALKIPRKTFVFSNLVTAIPYSIAFAVLGATGKQIIPLL